MPDIDPEIKALQDSIFLNKVARARRMTPAERFLDGLRLSANVMGMIALDTAGQTPAQATESLRKEFARRLRIRRAMIDHNFFKPAGSIDDE